MGILDKKELLEGIFGNLVKDCVLMITGQSGAGKGTLVKRLHTFIPEHLRLFGVGTGEEFRKGIDGGFSPIVRRRIRTINDSGGLQDPLIAASLVVGKIMRELKGNDLIVVEGSPRTRPEAEYLHRYTCDFLQRRIVLLNLVVSDELAIQRMIQRKEEDRLAGRKLRTDTATPEARQKKAAFYHEHVVPAVNYMSRRSQTEAVVISIDTDNLSPDHVLEQVLGRMPVSDTVRA